MIERNDLLLLIKNVMNEESEITNNGLTNRTALLDELENILNDLFGIDITFNILNDVICNVKIDRKKRLQIMDTMLSIKGLN